MSVKVVSPTDPGQPELPMSLRPQPAPAGSQRGRSRQCLAPGAEPRQRSSAVDSRQPQLPISLCTSAVAEAGQPESVSSPVAEAGSELPSSSPSDVADHGRPEADSRQSELPLPALAIPEQARPVDVGVVAGRPESFVADSAVADSVQLELPAAALAPQPAAPSFAAAPAAARPPVVASPAVGASELPVPEAPAGPELPMALRPPGADSDQSQLPMSLRPPASPAAAGLLAQARRGLAEAAQETRPAERFIGAYLAALRGAAAVLAARGRPHRGRARPASTWVLLDSVAPELREWSAFFASNSATRAAAQAGITGKVTAESAAGLVGAATPFLELVRRLVHGLPITGEAHVA
ncbi:SAV_6107 family HEPN domain-containing protein [Amycolatopsis sp. NPDC005003]